MYKATYMQLYYVLYCLFPKFFSLGTGYYAVTILVLPLFIFLQTYCANPATDYNFLGRSGIFLRETFCYILCVVQLQKYKHAVYMQQILKKSACNPLKIFGRIFI